MSSDGRNEPEDDMTLTTRLRSLLVDMTSTHTAKDELASSSMSLRAEPAPAALVGYALE